MDHPASQASLKVPFPRGAEKQPLPSIILSSKCGEIRFKKYEPSKVGSCLF
jgi:hypothetical protein